MTPEQRLEKEIAKRPNDIPKYLELAELHITRERYDRAEEVYSRAYEASDGSDDVRERWEDAQLRNLRHKLARAQKEAKEDGSEEAKGRCQLLQQEVNDKDLEIHENRVKRYPNNLAFRYELGICCYRNRRFNEAIAEYQQARNDPRLKGRCLLALGQCFQQIKQYKLAQSHYDEAIQEISDRDADNKKQALYLAGRLAAATGNLDVAERHLTTLAGLDFGYRDVSTLLDKIARLRENPDEKSKEGDQ